MAAFARKEAHVLDHEEWLGYVQPVGLVVSIPAMLNAGAILNRNFGPGHARFLAALPSDRDGEPVPEIRDFSAFAKQTFEWTDNDLTPAPPEVEIALTDYHETLRPTHVLREEKPRSGYILLIDELPFGTDLDQPAAHEDSRHWQASPQSRFERLLRATGVPIGLLVNGRQIRLVYAPKGESSGYITFKVADMVRIAGRPIYAALHMLLCAERIYLGEEKTRLAAVLADSRKYQNVVSTKLSGQVLEALYELLRGFQSADDATHNELLRDTLKDNPHLVYSGLVVSDRHHSSSSSKARL